MLDWKVYQVMEITATNVEIDYSKTLWNELFVSDQEKKKEKDGCLASQ